MTHYGATHLLLALVGFFYGWQIYQRLHSLWWLVRSDERRPINALADMFPVGFVIGLLAATALSVAVIFMTATNTSLMPKIWLVLIAIALGALLRGLALHWFR